MTALLLDGFDHYGTGTAGQNNMLDGVWSAIMPSQYPGVPTWGAARTGNYCLVYTTDGITGNGRIVIPGSPAVMFASFGFALDFLPPGTAFNICDFRNGLNVVQYYLQINPTGSLSLVTGGGTVVASTSGPVIRAQTWHFIELSMNYTTNTFTLRVDDTQATNTPAMTVTGLTSSTNSFLAFSTNANYGTQAYPQRYYDDLFIRDNTSTVNNSWLGDRRVALLMANADTATAGWTPNYYKLFGAGTLACATLGTNSTTPTNPGASVYTAGTTALDTGSSDFTLESWVRFEQLPGAANYSSIFSRWDVNGNKRSYRLILGGSSFNNSSLQFDYSTDGTSSTITTPIIYPFTPNLNQWYHIALVRASNELLLFVNGAQLGLPIACSATFFGGGSEVFSWGAEWGTSGLVSNTYLVGMYDETRFTNGYARYTAPFAVPTAAFPRGASLDTHWSQVVLLAGYDSSIVDESSYTRTLTAANGAVQFVPSDGSTVGNYSTVNKQTPDDNTFMSASYVAATAILTMTTQPTNGTTVTVGTTNGSTAAVYTFNTTLGGAYSVLIDTTAENTLLNLYNAINKGPGIGTKYGTGTLANYNVSAIQLPAGQIEVQALTAGTGGNSIACSSTSTATWNGTTLSGGSNIPGPSAFSLQAPPANTTIISAISLLCRAYKSDSGTCTLTNVLVGGLGGTETGSAHALATNAGYYPDIFQTDPDTGSSITPATLLNGKVELNRTA
jgi:hypothetical protein